MSIFGMMGTAVSGLLAQANMLSTISDNISNSSTPGYKRATADFSTLLGNVSPGGYSSGGVNTQIRYDVTQSGTYDSTSSVTDLAIKGNGFFVVSDSSGALFLTRAGSFVPDANGNLVNAAGYYLMGYGLAGANPVTNGTTGLQLINTKQAQLQSSPTTQGTFTGNLPANATVVPAANLPSTNSAGAQYTDKTSITTYDDLGNAVTLDVYTTLTAANKWEVDVYNAANAAAGGGFPYSQPALATQTLTFDPTTGKLAATSANSVTVAIPNGQNVTIDMSTLTQFAASYTGAATANGSAPSKLDHVAIDPNGVLSFVYANGSTGTKFQVALGNVESPDNLAPQTGNAYEATPTSGTLQIGTAGSGGLGTIASSTLENSTVDLATELTNMIEAQQAYQANSKVLQTGADLMSVINSIKT